MRLFQSPSVQGRPLNESEYIKVFFSLFSWSNAFNRLPVTITELGSVAPSLPPSHGGGGGNNVVAPVTITPWARPRQVLYYHVICVFRVPIPILGSDYSVLPPPLGHFFPSCILKVRYTKDPDIFFHQCCGFGSVGSVINWPTRSGSKILFQELRIRSRFQIRILTIS